MFTTMRLGLLLLWVAVLYGSLQVGSLPGDWGHICGAWGCGPKIQALVAFHSFWLVLWALPVIAAIGFVSPRARRRVGLGLMALALAGMVAVAIWEAVTWLPGVASPDAKLLVGRYFFRLACLVDLPLVQTLLAGMALLASTRLVVRTCPDMPANMEAAPPS